MNRSKLHLLRNMAAALLLCAGLASCSQDELPGQGNPLPEGEYPLILNAGGLEAVATPAQKSAPSTSGTVDNDWTGTEGKPVAVQVGDGTPNKYEATGLTNSDKNATLRPIDAANTHYWQSSTEKKTITAWHPYSDTYPTAWEVEANQNADGGYQASDLIKGELTLSFTDKDNADKNRITFAHQTAKVIVNLIPDGVTLDDNTSVQLLDIEGVKGTEKTITAYRPNTSEQTYLALLCGQEIEAGKGFIQVNVGNNKFVYTPTATKILANGTAYTYTITVKADGIEVTAATVGEWTDGGSESVGVTITYDGKETEPKIGDYYYSDGTWSDGGLRKLYADGRMKWAETTPEPENDKTVIAIVFYAGRHEKDNSDYTEPLTDGGPKLADGKVHGYAVALTDATSGYCQWGVYGTELGCCPTDGSGNKLNNYDIPDIDWSGYAWTQKIITAAGNKNNLNATEDAGYPATYYAVVDYENKVKAPANSSGWFLPSIGQMWNVYQQRSLLTSAGGSNLRSDDYWSSSEYYYRPAYFALRVYVSSVNVSNFNKDDSICYVRAVLAF